MLHNQLKDMRTQRGLTLRQLAAGTGLAISILSEIERGKMEPSMWVLQKIADYYQSDITIVIRPSPKE